MLGLPKQNYAKPSRPDICATTHKGTLYQTVCFVLFLVSVILLAGSGLLSGWPHFGSEFNMLLAPPFWFGFFNCPSFFLRGQEYGHC